MTLLDREHPTQQMLAMGQLTNDVLHDHHSPVDDEAEVHGSEAHQIARDPKSGHADHGTEERQRNGTSHDQRSAEIAQKQQEHHDHQHGPFRQVALHGPHGAIDQVRAVVHHLDFDPPGQSRLKLGNPKAHAVGDDPAVLTHEHHHGTQHGFLAILRGRAGPRCGIDANLGQIPDPQRLNGRGELHGQVPNFVEGGGFGGRPEHQLPTCAVDDAASGVLGVPANRLGQFGEGQVGLTQFFRIGLNDDLSAEAADGVDLSHSRRGAQERLGDEFLGFLQFEQLSKGIGGAIRRISPPRQGVVEDLPQTGGNRSQGGIGSHRQAVTDRLDALGHQLAAPINIHAILELEGHLREPVLGERAQFMELRQSGQFLLEDPGHQHLRFLGRQGRDLGVDLNLRLGDVGNGIDGQLARRPNAHGQQGRRRQHDDRPLAQGEFEDALDHGRAG